MGNPAVFFSVSRDVKNSSNIGYGLCVSIRSVLTSYPFKYTLVLGLRNAGTKGDRGKALQNEIVISLQKPKCDHQKTDDVGLFPGQKFNNSFHVFYVL